jgi:hypothetical protein
LVRAGPVRPFIVRPSGKPEESFLAQDFPDSRNAEPIRPRPFEFVPNVVNRVVLLAQGDDLISDRVLVRLRLRSPRHGPEEVPIDLTVPEPVAEDAKRAGLVAKGAGRLGAAEALDVKSPQGLVLTVAGVTGFQEKAGLPPAGQGSYPFQFL